MTADLIADMIDDMGFEASVKADKSTKSERSVMNGKGKVNHLFAVDFLYVK